MSPSNLREPGQPDFAEPWQAEAYAMAQTLIGTGQIAAAQWASELGATLREAADRGASDDDQTYYGALTETLARLLVAKGCLEAREIEQRIEDWRAAYMRTPHGKPVTLTAG